MTVDRLETEITLNRIAQGHLDRQGAIDWFEAVPESDRRDVLRILVYMVLQARGSSQDVTEAVQEARLKPTYTPCVMLRNGPLNLQLAKAIQLPSNELSRLFLLLIALLRISDNRRRADCGTACKHWWHRDLGDELVIEEIRRKYKLGTVRKLANT